MAHPVNVVVVGQTPPPSHGQAIMLELLLSRRYRGTTLHHVPMTFSATMMDVGRVRFRKIVHLVTLVYNIIRVQRRVHAEVLYYPPAGPNWVAVARDVAVLVATRWMFRRTVFHFHAAGLSQLYGSSPRWVRPLLRLAYFHADVGIRLDPSAPPDPQVLQAKREVIVPNAIEDVQLSPQLARRTESPAPTILYLGALRESKGVIALVRACGRLHREGIEFRLTLAGPDTHETSAERCRATAREEGIEGYVSTPGVMDGAAKRRALLEADIFALPSHYESEGSPLAILEAMSAGLPIVATEWRGIPGLVRDGEDGFLVPPGDVAALATALADLVRQPALRRRFGAASRKRYVSEFSPDRYHDRTQALFDYVATTLK